MEQPIFENTSSPRKSTAFFARWGILAIVALFVVYTIILGIYTIEEGHVGIVKRWGKAVSAVEPGLNFKMPYMESVEEIEIRPRKNEEVLAASTSETMPIVAKVSINWAVIKEQSLDLYVGYGGLSQFESRILDPRLRSATKEAIAKHPADKIIQQREVIIGDIQTSLSKTMQGFPVELDSVQLEDLKLPENYLQAIEEKQREKELAKAEEHRLTKQQHTAQQAVNTANADRDSQKARADGMAYEINTIAQAEAAAIKLKGSAEAEAIQKKAEAIANNLTLVEYTRALNWDGKMPTTVMGEGTNVLWGMGTR